MSIIKPNFPLIKKILSELNEVAQISSSKNFDKDYVLNKVHLLIQNLTELNRIQKDVLEEYEKKQHELYMHMNQQVAEVESISEASQKYVKWTEKYVELTQTNNILTEDFMAEGKKYETIIESVSENYSPMNTVLLKEVLETYTQIRFTKKRKHSIWWNYQIFRLNIFYRSILNVLISALVGFGIEKLTEKVLPSIPDFLVTIVIAFLIFFTLEKFLGKKFSLFFWRLLQRQAFRLYSELELYLAHIKVMV